MGLYIKSMEMPKNKPLLVKINPDGSVSTTARNGYRKYEAVHVPEHGDLIDRNYLKQTHCAECTLYPDNCLEKIGKECDWESIVHLNMCPVIIPAEEGE